MRNDHYEALSKSTAFYTYAAGGTFVQYCVYFTLASLKFMQCYHHLLNTNTAVLHPYRMTLEGTRDSWPK